MATRRKKSYRGLKKDELFGIQLLMLRIRAFENKVFELLARDVLKGKEGTPHKNAPPIIHQRGDWEMNLCLRPRGRHLTY